MEPSEITVGRRVWVAPNNGSDPFEARIEDVGVNGIFFQAQPIGGGRLKLVHYAQCHDTKVGAYNRWADDCADRARDAKRIAKEVREEAELQAEIDAFYTECMKILAGEVEE